MLKLFNKEHVAIGALTNLKDYKIEYLLSGEDLVEFSLSITDENIHLAEEEGYVQNKFNEYVIKAIDPSKSYKRFSCMVNVESIKGKSIANFDTSNNTITDTIRLAIAGTGWILSDNNITKRRTVRLKNTNALEVLREVRKVFRVDFRFDAINKIIYVYEKFGSDKGVYFTDELNLIDLKVPSETHNYTTRLYPYGKDGLNIVDINNGKEYIENFQYSNKVIELIWEDNRYTIIDHLKEDAVAKLEELSKPKRTYQADIADLAKYSEEYNFLDFFLGDTITLISKSEKFRDKQRIIKYIEYPNDPSQNTCELGNTTLTFEEFQQENEYKNQVVDNITTDNGTIDGSTVDGIHTDQIYDFKSQVIQTVDFSAINAKITNLEATNVTITGELNSVKANIGTLTSNIAIIDKLTITHSASINDLQSNKASITQLEAVNATISVLEANVGKIETLVNGNLSSENIQTGGITSDKLTISNGYIKNAMIDSLDVSKVNAGNISTNKFRIKSDNGNMVIADNTIQIRDNSRVRVQIGKDASNDYNMYVWDSKGNLMFDATGLKSNGIKDKIIRNDMISDNANIDGGKLNINSVVSSINNGSTTIKSSKVQLDGTNQTLDVSFNSLKTEVQCIEVGGRNLVLSSELPPFSPNNTGTGNRVSMSEGSIKFNRSKPDNGKLVSQYLFLKDSRVSEPLLLDGSTKYTLAMDFRTNKDTIIELYISTGEHTKIAIKAGIWTRVKCEGITLSSTSDMACIFRTDTIDTIVDYKMLKLENGNKVSGWSPSPEEVEGNISNLKEITTTQSTTISVMQGQINTAINNTQIVKDGKTILLKDDYNRTVQTVDSMKSTIGSHTTQIDQATGDITKVETRVNTVERDLNGIATRVSSTETNINTVNNLANNANNKALSAEQLAKAMSDSKMIHLDPNFRKGYNNVSAYNNANNGNVTVTRITKVSDCPTTSTHYLEIKHIGAGSPGFGGFYQNITSRANAIFIQKFIAKLPNGYALNTASNSMGTGYTDKWLTPNQGTGKWETYMREVRCGATGTFSSGGHVYVSGSPTPTTSSPLVWYLAYCTCFDLTDNDETVNSLKTELSTTTSKVSSIETNLTSIASRVSSVESTTTSINGQINNLSTRMNSAEQKITDSSIISTVSSQFYSKGQSDSMYTNKSTFEQTVDDFTFKFDRSGSENLWKNSWLKAGSAFWDYVHWYNGDGSPESSDISVTTGNNSDGWVPLGQKVMRIINYGGNRQENTHWHGVRQFIKVEPFTSYTFSFYVAQHRTKGCMIEFKRRDNGENFASLFTSPDDISNSQNWNASFENNFTLVKRTILVPRDCNEIEVLVWSCGRTSENASYLWVAMPQFERGFIATARRLNSNEVYSDTTRIDEEGVIVYHDNGDYTRMSSQGLKRHRSNGDAKGDYHYLTHYVGFTTLSDPNGYIWIQLPNDFKNKHFTAYATISDTWQDSWNWGEPWVVQRFVVYVETSMIDYANARVPIKGYRTDKNYSTGARRNKEVAGLLLVIA